MSHYETPIACDLSALTEEERKEHEMVGRQVFGTVQEIHELSDGYAFQMPAELDQLQAVAKFIAREKLCCPFYDFTLKLERESGPMWLSLTGREGVKAFLQEGLLSLDIGTGKNG